MDHDQLPLLFIEQTGLAELYPTQPFTECLLHQGNYFTVKHLYPKKIFFFKSCYQLRNTSNTEVIIQSMVYL